MGVENWKLLSLWSVMLDIPSIFSAYGLGHFRWLQTCCIILKFRHNVTVVYGFILLRYFMT